MNHKQEAFNFLAKHKKPIKEFGDQELIREYNKVLMGLSKKLDVAEERLNENQCN